MDDPIADPLIRLALDMPDKAGLAVLLRLGTYDVWRGSLTEMRRDQPSEPATYEAPTKPENSERAARLFDVLVMRRAIGCMDERCRTLLWMQHVERQNFAAIARQFGVPISGAEQLVADCKKKAYDTFAALKNQNPRELFDDIPAAPVEKREQAPDAEYERLRKWTA